MPWTTTLSGQQQRRQESESDLMVGGPAGGSAGVQGVALEVVVTSDTTIYKDVTPDSVPPGGKVQQQVATGSLDEIGSNSFVSAWGERRGDRVIAKVLMYSQLVMVKRL